MARVRSARFERLDTRTLYALLRLRVDVFVVEQNCPYPEVDGRDVEPETVHVWAEADDRIVAYLRVLTEPDGRRIGRVCTAEAARGRGLAGQLMSEALRHVGDTPAWLHAQTPAIGLYRRHGFAAQGPEFLVDGIPHVLMRREASG
ncbi:MAG: GNAT family N-acetyltransferase [Stackebrandtia sp.]